MPITFGGMASGLPPNIVDQLMDAERIPVKKLQANKEKSNDKLKLVTDLETKVNDVTKSIGELANTRGFSDIKLTSGDPNIVQGTVDPANAQSGSWNIEVIQLAQKAAAMTNGFPDKDRTQLGVGYFTFTTPEGKKEVYINSSSNTLEGAANTINAAHIGVRAAVINDRKEPDAPFKLVISSDAMGQDNQIEYPRLYFLDGDQDLNFDSQREATNGIVKVDGFEFEISDNTLKDVIPGVTLDLKQSAPGRNVNVTVKEDLELVTGKIKSFVDGMNGVLGFIQTQNKVDKATDTTKTLGGDSLLRSVEMRMRSLVQNPQYGVKGSVKTLNQIGILFNRSGLLEFDQKKFMSALGRDPGGVQAFFAGDGFQVGFIPTLKREITNLTNQSFGPITNRKKGLQSKIEQFDRQIETKEKQLEKKEEQLRNKFAKLEETMSKIKSSGAQMASFGGGGGGGFG